MILGIACFAILAALVTLALLVTLNTPAALAQYPNPPDKPPSPGTPSPSGVRQLALDNWAQINASGFGDPNVSWVNALCVFNGDLYGGTSSTSLDGGEIWRYTGGLGWTNVMTGGFRSISTTWGISNSWVSYLTPFHGELYAGTQNLSTGAEIWRSGDSIHWTPVMTGGFGLRSNQEIMHLTVYSDTLYATAGNWESAPFARGAQIWRTSDGLNWTNVVTRGFGNPNSAAVIALQDIGGELYAGTWSDVSVGQLWRSPTGDFGTWTSVTSDGFANPNTRGIPCLAFYNGNYYAGTRNWTTGAEVYRSPDAVTWTRVVSNGFGAGLNAGWVDSLSVYGGKLYAAVRDYDRGVKVYVTSDGVNWPQSNSNGWGDAANQHSSDGDNAALVYNGALSIGTFNPIDGAQIWQLNPAGPDQLSVTSSGPTVLGHATTFTATLAAGRGETYAWFFGNGASLITGRKILTYTYPTTGTYHAVVTATNILGSLSAATTVTVAIRYLFYFPLMMKNH